MKTVTRTIGERTALSLMTGAAMVLRQSGRAVLLLLMMVIAIATAQATDFISDVKLIGGTKAECNALKTTLTADGWTFIDQDLNKGASGDYVYLLYKAEANTDGVNWGYITDFYIHKGKNPDSSLTYGGREYTLVSYDGGDWFVSHYGDLNSNCGSNSDYIYLYYTKALFTDCRAVTGITFNATSSGAVGQDGGSTAYDLNSGAGGDYIYMHFTTATAMTGHQPQASLEACTGGKYQISVSGWAYDPDATAQSITVQAKIYQSNGTTLYRTETLTANQANANAGVSGNHGFAATFTNIPAATYKLKFFAIDYNGDGDTQIGATQTVIVTGTQSRGHLDACNGGEGEITVSGWAYDPDVAAQSIGVLVKVYQSDGTTLYKEETLTADRPRNDVNNAYSITGQHGFSGTIDIADSGTYKVKVYAIDYNGDSNPQLGSTQTVRVTSFVRLTSETGAVTLHDGDRITGTGGANTHVTIADGATVTLSGVNITDIRLSQWAGITCLGDAVIILADGTTNNVKAGHEYHPGIFVPENKTLTIRGSGTLNASKNDHAAGIGGGMQIPCGNIVIDGGTIEATGGAWAAGIGGGWGASCGNITITANITSVTATMGNYAPYHIGCGLKGSNGTVTISSNLIDVTSGSTRMLWPGMVLIDNADNSTAISSKNGQTIDVQLRDRTLYRDGTWNTLCLPFNLTSFEGMPLEGATVKTLTSTSFAGDTLTMNFSDNLTSIEAGRPYIVKWTTPAADIVSPVFNLVTISTATANVSTQYVDFIGTYSPTVIYESGTEKHNLFLGDANTLYYPTAEGYKVNAFRGYFQLKNGITAGTPIGQWGNVNGDNEVSIADLTALVNLLHSSSHGADNAAADVNEDGTADTADVDALASLLLGKLPAAIRVRFVDGNGELLYEGVGNVVR